MSSGFKGVESLLFGAFSPEQPEIVKVSLNRPSKRNAIDGEMWEAIGECFKEIAECPVSRVVILDAVGDTFTAGIDMMLLASLAPQLTCAGRNARALKTLIAKFQKSYDRALHLLYLRSSSFLTFSFLAKDLIKSRNVTNQ